MKTFRVLQRYWLCDPQTSSRTLVAPQVNLWWVSYASLQCDQLIAAAFHRQTAKNTVQSPDLHPSLWRIDLPLLLAEGAL